MLWTEREAAATRVVAASATTAQQLGTRSRSMAGTIRVQSLVRALSVAQASSTSFNTATRSRQ